jgi:hypothetical protein
MGVPRLFFKPLRGQLPPIETRTWRLNAMNPLNNHRQSLVLGIILALVLAVILGG